MVTVKISDPRDQLSGCLQFVRDGEEVVICDNDEPIARILPFAYADPNWEANERLVASGAMTTPAQGGEMDWNGFFRLPAANVPNDVAVQAVLDSRSDR